MNRFHLFSLMYMMLFLLAACGQLDVAVLSPKSEPGIDAFPSRPAVPPENSPGEIVRLTLLPTVAPAVEAGDILSRIARRTGGTVEKLVTANCLADPDHLSVGQTLYVPQVVDVAMPPTPTVPALVGQWSRFTDSLYQVSFDYPTNWQDVSHGLMTRLAGEDGFIQLAAMGAPYELNYVTDDQANHKLMPYGSSPRIEIITLSDGRDARLIFPSGDHLPALVVGALLITQYAEPIQLSNYAVNYLTLAADVNHIRRIAASLHLPPPPSEIGIGDFKASVEEVPPGGKRITFLWTSHGATRGTITSGTAQRFSPWWPVEACGELTVDLAGTIFPNPAMTLRVSNDMTGQVLHYPDTWSAGESEGEPVIWPPDGLVQPMRCFGKVWRPFPRLIEELGWATAPEFGYELAFQGESREGIPGVNYLTTPNGGILQMVDLNWHPFIPGQAQSDG